MKTAPRACRRRIEVCGFAGLSELDGSSWPCFGGIDDRELPLLAQVQNARWVVA